MRFVPFSQVQLDCEALRDSLRKGEALRDELRKGGWRPCVTRYVRGGGLAWQVTQGVEVLRGELRKGEAVRGSLRKGGGLV